MTAVDNLALTNYGHFTTMRVQDGAVRGLGLHLDRLVTDCATVFGAELSRGYVRERIRAAIAEADAPLTVRVTVADPGLRLDRPAAPADPHVLVTTRAATPQPQPPIRVRSTTHVRDVPAVKHTGLFGPLFERRRAQLDGYDDALFTDGGGRVGEGPTWNVGFVEGDTLVWPLADVLAGVTMRLLAAAHDGPQRTEPVELSRLSGMAAAFATNAAGAIRPIAAVDGVTFATDHPIIGLLRRRYAEVVPEAV
ncbi:aminotransferase class IV [Micromonospora rubida]|uniref:Aminotransferase class IV n=1 Tax=Micromonospora rubida TaxID=2697657 RepID=A0ABW7SKV1_9ACTN